MEEKVEGEEHEAEKERNCRDLIEPLNQGFMDIEK